MDQGFPLIQYEIGKTSREWGQAHGEQFRVGIHELAAIRTELMMAQNPNLQPKQIETLAAEQWGHNAAYSQSLHDELIGICEGAHISQTDLIVLNNYTDFRDLLVEDQGCSTTFVKTDSETLAGQTWDMHRSAKDYIAVIKIPSTEGTPEVVVFTLVGCLGMAGMNAWGSVVEVNNLHTHSQQTGVSWPAQVRNMLTLSNYQQMETALTQSQLTSGRAFVLASEAGGQLWEVSSSKQEKLAEVDEKGEGYFYHTNHCVGDNVGATEIKARLSKTTKPRYELLKKNMPHVKNQTDLLALLKGHENYPISICTHYESGAKDPSFTCGGFVANIRKKTIQLWRGCETYDSNYKSYEYQF